MDVLFVMGSERVECRNCEASSYFGRARVDWKATVCWHMAKT